MLTGLPQTASCTPGPCDMIIGTTTTITGLQCNDDGRLVSVSAVNCRGVGTASQCMMIAVDGPGECYVINLRGVIFYCYSNIFLT